MAGDLLGELRTLERYSHWAPARLEQVAEIAEKLRQATLFESLTNVELAFIAEKGRSVKYECADLIIREGDLDKTFYVIVSGQVRVWSKDDDGVPRLLNYHAKGDFFGEIAPLDNAPRAANVDVVDDVELIAFDEDGFERLIDFPQINDYLRTWGQERIEKSNRPFEGKHWDEISIVVAHKSWFALLQIISFPVIVSLLSLALFAVLVAYTSLAFEVLLSLTIAITIGMGLWAFWMYEDWHNDDLIVTSKRIIHIERVLVPPFPLVRREASIDQVLDITTRNLGLLTHLLRVSTLQVKTARGMIEFPYLDKAEMIRDEIFRARELARVRRIGEERSRIRQKLLTELERPTKQVMPLESGEEPGVTPERRGLDRALHYFVPHTRIVKPDSIIWRKHWIALVQAAGLPALLFVLSLVLLVFVLARPGFLRDIPLSLLVVVPAIAILVTFVWYLWSYDGWRNDIYIVTDERIIDIEGSPFHLKKESRTEGTFDVIQNTDYSSPNWLSRILRIGDVTIDTAAQKSAFTFNSVARPEEVQQEIFKRLTAFREKRERESAERQYAEFTKWFGTYHRSVMDQKEQ